jgi:error-prone DNA polymerase
MAALFLDHRGACERSRELGDRLHYTMADLGYRFPDYPVPPGDTQISFLRKITDVGARERYRPYHDRARAQIARELDMIEKLQLAGYFLIVWDIVNFCRQHDVLVQGRGSAANSAVCYSLGITAVDPVGMDPCSSASCRRSAANGPTSTSICRAATAASRSSSTSTRSGRLGAAMTANVITYRGRSAAREVGKALGFDPGQVDRLAKVMNNFEFIDPGDSLPRQMSAVGLDLNSARVRLFARLWGEMQDLPRHLGQHSGGMVICQGQLDACVPLENASMPGRVVVQWDKDDCADMGIVKVDLLGLGMMAVIRTRWRSSMRTSNRRERRDRGKGFSSAGSAISAVKRPVVDLAHLPQNDPAVYKMILRGRHHRRVPGRVARADGDAAAAAAEGVLRHRRAGGDHPPRADRRADGASVSEPPRRPRAGALRASGARADPRADARCRCSRNSCCG